MLKRIVLVLICITLASCNMKEPLVIGHRGAMGHETENTLPSIQKAMDLGVDMINIEDYYITDLNKVIVEGGHKIPMLQDVLKLINNKVALNIELKGAGTADKVNFIMNYYIEKKNWSPDNFIISSFNWDELKEMRKRNPKVAIAVLTEENPVDAIAVAKELNAVAINPYFKNLDLEKANEIRDAGFKIYTWTVNEPSDIDAMKHIGVDGIITNFPERVK